jgi:hypothetical protein
MNNLTEIKTTGGANIGWVRTSWPFATLIVNKDRLELKASIMGSYIFTPSDIISIEPAGILLGGGIRINHTVDSYNKSVVFRSSEGAANLIKSIAKTGFLNNTTPPDAYTVAVISQARLNSGFAIKTTAVIGIVVIWNLLFLVDYRNLFMGDSEIILGGIGMRLASVFMIITAISLLTVEPVQQMILKPGRSVQDFRYFLYFIILICGIMLAAMIAIPVA